MVLISELGPQYFKDDSFKAKARLHQSLYRKNILKANYSDYGNRLAEKEALEGKNFYLGLNGIFEGVQKRYKLKYSPLYFDMLRSEHIPFNFFIPFNYYPDLARAIINQFVSGVVRRMNNITIEYSPKPKETYLNDATAFDTYIRYEHIDGTQGIIGIEVKYTERSYPYGYKERNDIYNPSSIYNQLTSRIDIYKDTCLDNLKLPKYKQVWRNQLLGERMLEVDQELKHFTSIILFPKGNDHFVNVCSEYKKFLKEKFQPKFVGITYEDFIEVGNMYCKEDRSKLWIEYLKNRYIVVDDQ